MKTAEDKTADRNTERAQLDACCKNWRVCFEPSRDEDDWDLVPGLPLKRAQILMNLLRWADLRVIEEARKGNITSSEAFSAIEDLTSLDALYELLDRLEKGTVGVSTDCPQCGCSLIRAESSDGLRVDLCSRCPWVGNRSDGVRTESPTVPPASEDSPPKGPRADSQADLVLPGSVLAEVLEDVEGRLWAMDDEVKVSSTDGRDVADALKLRGAFNVLGELRNRLVPLPKKDG